MESGSAPASDVVAPGADPFSAAGSGTAAGRHAETRINAAIDIQFEELTAATPEDLLHQARVLLLEYGRFVLAQPGAGRFCFGALEQEAHGLPASFRAQGGGSLLALAGGEPAGFVAWRIPAANTAIRPDSLELKRLWVRPTYRGLGLGRMLTQAVLDRAISARRKAVYLDTAPRSMARAHRLYLEMGFQSCSPYNDNPVEGLAWLVKYL